jgi:hypothetical protein
MPDANYYVRQGKLLLSMSSGGCDPVLSGRLREIAEDYMAKAVKLRMGLQLPPVMRGSADEARSQIQSQSDGFLGPPTGSIGTPRPALMR